MYTKMKFRAWNNKENRWVTHDEHLEETKVSASTTPPSILEIEHPDWDLEICMNERDKKGKLIFDGDIIDFVFFYYREYEYEVHRRGQVVFHDSKCFMFVISDDLMYDFSELSYDSENDIEIIGNIHENPEIEFSRDLK